MDPGERFIEVIAPAVRQAAAVARALEGRVPNRPKSGEASEVKAALTIADSASQEAILVPLAEHFPEVSLEAEEDTPSVASFPSRARFSVVVDPIDGTLHAYLEGRGPYSVIVGLREADAYVAGVVALPREGIFLAATAGGGAFRTRPLAKPHPVHVVADGPRVLVSFGMPERVLDALRSSGFEPVFGSGGAIAVAPLLPGVRAGLRLAPNGGSISIRGRVGVLLAREGGAVAWGADGEPFPKSTRAPARALLVAALPEDLQSLRAALDAR